MEGDKSDDISFGSALQFADTTNKQEEIKRYAWVILATEPDALKRNRREGNLL